MSLRATQVVRRPAVRDERVVETVTLDHRARVCGDRPIRTDSGRELVLALGRTVRLADGDALKLEDDGLVRVVAAPERLLQVTTNAPARLLRLAWQLGGRHVAVEVGEDALFIPHDAALAELVRGQGGMAVAIERPFAPEVAQNDHGHHHDVKSCGCASDGEDAPGRHGEPRAHAHHHHGGCGCGHNG